MPSRVRRAKYRDDPLVTISPRVLRAVLAELGLTVTELAQRTGNSQQTVSHLATGDTTKRCRQSRLSALAKALGVAEEMLGGEQGFFRRGTQIGYECWYSARTQFAVHRLLVRAHKAFERDARRERRAGDLERSDELRAWSYLENSLLELLKVGEWRRMLIEWQPPRPERQGYREPLAQDLTVFDPAPVNDPAHEEATLALVRAFEHILTPWFDGKAALDYARLRDLAVMPQGGMPPRGTHTVDVIPPWHDVPAPGEAHS